MEVFVVRLWRPAAGLTPELRGTAEHVGGGEAAFRDERELAAFLHHCLSVGAVPAPPTPDSGGSR